METYRNRSSYKDTPEFKEAYALFKKKHKMKDDDESEYHLFACIYGMEKLKDINPYNKYRYNKNNDDKVEVG